MTALGGKHGNDSPARAGVLDQPTLATHGVQRSNRFFPAHRADLVVAEPVS
jgi:hypothetical protein